MILHSITRHVRDQNWFSVGIAFVIVIDAALEAQQVCINTGYRFCVIGGLALQRWGEPRFSAAICPGVIDTPMHHRLRKDIGDEVDDQGLLPNLHLRRAAHPEEIARPIVLLRHA